MTTIFKITKTNGISSFHLPNYIKDNYSSLEEAKEVLNKLIDETKSEYSTVSELRKKENWLDDYEVPQNDVFWLEILEFEVDEHGNEEEINFGIEKTEDFYIS